MRLWIPISIVALVVIAYAYFYAISASESQGATSLGLANYVGLIGVFFALIAAGFILRRATPHQ